MPALPAGQHVCPLSRRAYILDVASEMAQVDGGYALWFRRVLWDQPLKFDNELYVTMHYNQVRACGRLWSLRAPPGLASEAFVIPAPRPLVPMWACHCHPHFLIHRPLSPGPACFSCVAAGPGPSSQAAQVTRFQAVLTSFLLLPSSAEHLACPVFSSIVFCFLIFIYLTMFGLGFSLQA